MGGGEGLSTTQPVTKECALPWSFRNRHAQEGAVGAHGDSHGRCETALGRQPVLT